MTVTIQLNFRDWVQLQSTLKQLQQLEAEEKLNRVATYELFELEDNVGAFRDILEAVANGSPED